MAAGQGAAQILAFSNGEDRRVMACFRGNTGASKAGEQTFGGFGHQASCQGAAFIAGVAIRQGRTRPDITRK